jgi:hypothetical protein
VRLQVVGLLVKFESFNAFQIVSVGAVGYVVASVLVEYNILTGLLLVVQVILPVSSMFPTKLNLLGVSPFFGVNFNPVSRAPKYAVPSANNPKLFIPLLYP